MKPAAIFFSLLALLMIYMVVARKDDHSDNFKHHQTPEEREAIINRWTKPQTPQENEVKKWEPIPPDESDKCPNCDEGYYQTNGRCYTCENMKCKTCKGTGIHPTQAYGENGWYTIDTCLQCSGRGYCAPYLSH